ncbi:hypothetical protein SHELI_v1c09850 [Spiroplasma helicoides]|uniref:Uncharacterized protein n=1 Tax=Spiroplasma helicoides TaxID=216938 RepID=A0A1B3SLX4_9MOLU|nr:hypothetical protein [Spiroplasma helicoides]AOG60932.1 hypothetical protein SHELI_v1c09850 [Spiroplasma helicoides]
MYFHVKKIRNWIIYNQATNDLNNFWNDYFVRSSHLNNVTQFSIDEKKYNLQNIDLITTCYKSVINYLKISNIISPKINGSNETNKYLRCLKCNENVDINELFRWALQGTYETTIITYTNNNKSGEYLIVVEKCSDECEG